VRLGVYGGTFDPFHIGHRAVVEGLLERFRFDRLLLVPAHIPPHKRHATISNRYHRVAMMALATSDLDRAVLSTIELDSPAPGYTVDTVARLHAEIPDSAPLCFVLGADSFEDLPLWHDYLRLVESCHIIVTARPGYDLDAGHLPEAVRSRIVDLRGAAPSDGPPESTDASTKIYLTDDAYTDVSSTTIRDRARTGASLEGLVAESVAAYIRKQELYTEPR
jgi:nicotinate-nucleotide adenylyltransferase